MKGKKRSEPQDTASISENSSFTENDRLKLIEINTTVKTMLMEVNCLKNELQKSKEEIKTIKIENERLKQALNLNIINLDALEQYNRRENIRIHGVSEESNVDDGEKVISNVAKALNIELEDRDIQRAHRLGKRKSINAKPRPVIVRFASYKKRNEFLYSKSKLKDTDDYGASFITEDLTPLRAKLLHYLKTECQDQYVMVHTLNGNIRMKKSAKKIGQYFEGKDEGTGKWLYVKSVDDLFKHGIDVDFEKLGYRGLDFNFPEREFDPEM